MTACDEVPSAHAALPARSDADLPVAGAQDLRLAFRRHASGVAIVTAGSYHGPVGFTATSLASVSADPPLVSFNLARSSSSWPAISLAGYVGIHLLGLAHEELAARFATHGADRFAPPTRWAPGPRRVPLLTECTAWLVAAVEQRIRVADQVIVVARVVHAGGPPDVTDPLVYHDGRFQRTVRPNESTRRRLARRRRG